jgi:hypothetical protein
MRKRYGSAGARWTSTGKHDYLVMALVLAVWSAKRLELPLSGELLRRRYV